MLVQHREGMDPHFLLTCRQLFRSRVEGLGLCALGSGLRVQDLSFMGFPLWFMV